MSRVESSRAMDLERKSSPMASDHPPQASRQEIKDENMGQPPHSACKANERPLSVRRPWSSSSSLWFSEAADQLSQDLRVPCSLMSMIFNELWT